MQSSPIISCHIHGVSRSWLPACILSPPCACAGCPSRAFGDIESAAWNCPGGVSTPHKLADNKQGLLSPAKPVVDYVSTRHQLALETTAPFLLLQTWKEDTEASPHNSQTCTCTFSMWKSCTWLFSDQRLYLITCFDPRKFSGLSRSCQMVRLSRWGGDTVTAWRRAKSSVR